VKLSLKRRTPNRKKKKTKAKEEAIVEAIVEVNVASVAKEEAIVAESADREEAIVEAIVVVNVVIVAVNVAVIVAVIVLNVPNANPDNNKEGMSQRAKVSHHSQKKKLRKKNKSARK
jgi:fucose permease